MEFPPRLCRRSQLDTARVLLLLRRSSCQRGSASPSTCRWSDKSSLRSKAAPRMAHSTHKRTEIYAPLMERTKMCGRIAVARGYRSDLVRFARTHSHTHERHIAPAGLAGGLSGALLPSSWLARLARDVCSKQKWCNHMWPQTRTSESQPRWRHANPRGKRGGAGTFTPLGRVCVSATPRTSLPLVKQSQACTAAGPRTQSNSW